MFLTGPYRKFMASAITAMNVLISTYVGNVMYTKNWSTFQITRMVKEAQSLKIRPMMKPQMMRHRNRQDQQIQTLSDVRCY